MKILTFLKYCTPYLLFGLAVSGCSFKPSHSIQLSEQARTFTLYEPHIAKGSIGDTARPLMLVLHGNPSMSWQMQMYTGMNKVARKNGFFVLYPDALDMRWPIEDSARIADEVGYVDELLDLILAEYQIDPSRIYISGMSGGGIFTVHLLSQLDRPIAGIGIVAGNVPKCVEEIQAAPTILIHGSGDFLYEGTDALYSVRKTEMIFANANGCNLEPKMEHVPDRKKRDDMTVEHFVYDCPTQQAFEYYVVLNGGHHWPGAKFNANHFTKRKLGKYNKDIKASEVIWEFMQSCGRSPSGQSISSR